MILRSRLNSASAGIFKVKLKNLQKSFLKVSLIFLGILGIAGAGFYFVYDMDEELVAEIEQLSSKISMAAAESNVLSKQLEDAGEAIAYYDNLNASGQGDAQNFRREFAKNLLADLRDRNSMFDLKLNMDPFTKVGGDYEKIKVGLYVSKVTVPFVAASDIDVFNLMRDISSTFPGNIEIKSYKIERSGNLDEATLLGIGQGRPGEGLVKGEIVFEWQGIQDSHDKESVDKPADSKPVTDKPAGGAKHE